MFNNRNLVLNGDFGGNQIGLVTPEVSLVENYKIKKINKKRNFENKHDFLLGFEKPQNYASQRIQLENEDSFDRTKIFDTHTSRNVSNGLIPTSTGFEINTVNLKPQRGIIDLNNNNRFT